MGVFWQLRRRYKRRARRQFRLRLAQPTCQNTCKDNEILLSNYDVAGQLVGSIDAAGNASYTVYDQRGRIATERLADPDGNGPQSAPVSTHTYDATGNVSSTTDPLGNKTTFTYDALNRLKAKTSHHELLLDDTADTPDVAFTVNTGTPSHYQSTLATGGDYTVVQSPNATVTWTTGALDAGTYRVAATWLASSLWATSATASVYKNGQLVAAPQINQSRSPVGFEEVDGDVSRLWQVLDGGVTVAAGDTISVQLVRLTGFFTNLVADAIRVDRVSVTEYGYDKNGNLTSENDSRGHMTSFAFDELSRQIKITTPDPDGAGTGNSPQETTTTYDGYSNAVKRVENRGTAATTDDRTDTFKFDRRNRLTEEILNVNAGTDSDDNVTTKYEYDLVGNLVSQIDALAHETHYRYDDLDRVIDQYGDCEQGRDTSTALVFSVPLFNRFNTSAYNGEIELSGGGTAVTMKGPIWAYYPLATGYAATHRTILELDVDFENLGPDYAIAFDTNGLYDDQEGKTRFIELAGTNPYEFSRYNRDISRAVAPQRQDTVPHPDRPVPDTGRTGRRRRDHPPGILQQGCRGHRRSRVPTRGDIQRYPVLRLGRGSHGHHVRHPRQRRDRSRGLRSAQDHHALRLRSARPSNSHRPG